MYDVSVGALLLPVPPGKKAERFTTDGSQFTLGVLGLLLTPEEPEALEVTETPEAPPAAPPAEKARRLCLRRGGPRGVG